jgi:peptide/nickel transport system permease protein
MLNFIVKRLANVVVLFFGITLLSFIVIHVAPGKPFLTMEFNPKMDTAAKKKIEQIYGLNRPVWVQYKDWIVRFSKFDFGYSISDGVAVKDKILQRIPVTLAINGITLVLIFFLGIVLGVSGAVRKGSWYDRCATFGMFLFFSLPTFWVSLLAIQFFSVHLGWFPVSGVKSLDFEYFSMGRKIGDFLWHISLPVAVSVIGALAGISRYVRERMLSVLREEYVTFAKAKGLPARTVIYEHALKNALLPVVTLLGLSLPSLLGGSVIFESIFSIPGIGRLFFEAVMSRDYPLIMGLLSISALLTLLSNVLADVGYLMVDPRIRLAGKHE